MSIRMGQIFWNLVAGLFVLRGGYHAPTQKEQHEFEEQVEHDRDPALDDAHGEDERGAAPRAEPSPQPAPAAVRPEVS
jgi:hypothetical protein